MGVDMHELRKTKHTSKCDHRTQVKQEINNIPMWICCDCSYINKIAIYDNKKIFLMRERGLVVTVSLHQRGADPP